MRVVALHGVACELQRCTQRRSSSSRNGPRGNGPSGNGPSGNGPSGNGPSGKRRDCRQWRASRATPVFAQPRVLAAQRSPVKPAKSNPLATSAPGLRSSIRHGSMRSRGTQGGTRVLRLGRAGRLPQCGGAGTPMRSPTTLRHSRCARRTRRCRRRARGRIQRTHAPAVALLGTHSRALTHSPQVLHNRAFVYTASSASTPRRSATTPRYAGPGADVDSLRSRRRCGRQRPTTGPTGHSRVYYQDAPHAHGAAVATQKHSAGRCSRLRRGTQRR